MYGSYTYHIRKSYPDMFYTDIFHPWCFYVIIKMLTYTYSCHFLLEVNNSYTRALIEICSPLTRKTTTGSNFYPFSVQWRDAIPPKFMKKVSSLTKNVSFKVKLSTNYIVNLSFLLLLQDFKIYQWDDVSEDYSGSCIFNYKFVFHLAPILPVLIF